MVVQFHRAIGCTQAEEATPDTKHTFCETIKRYRLNLESLFLHSSHSQQNRDVFHYPQKFTFILNLDFSQLSLQSSTHCIQYSSQNQHLIMSLAIKATFYR